MSHTHFCLLQALHHYTAVQLVSNHRASFLSELIHVSSIVQVFGNSFQTLCRWMSSLLCGSHHSSVSHCKNTSTGEKKIEDSIWKEIYVGVHDSIEWLISLMSLFFKFHIKLPRVPLKLSSLKVFMQSHTLERSHYIVEVHFSVWWYDFTITANSIPSLPYFYNAPDGTHTGDNSFIWTKFEKSFQWPEELKIQ